MKCVIKQSTLNRISTTTFTIQLTHKIGLILRVLANIICLCQNTAFCEKNGIQYGNPHSKIQSTLSLVLAELVFPPISTTHRTTQRFGNRFVQILVLKFCIFSTFMGQPLHMGTPFCRDCNKTHPSAFAGNSLAKL